MAGMAQAIPTVPRELGASTLRLAVCQAVVSSSLQLTATVGSVAATHLSGHESLAGSAVGVSLLAAAGALGWAAPLGDRHGRRPLLAAGFVLLAAGSLLVALAILVAAYPLFVVGIAAFGA